MEDDGWEAEDVQCRFRQFEKVSNFLVSQVLSCSRTPQATNFSTCEVQYMFTLDLMCMQYLCFSIIHQAACDMDFRIFNVPTQSFMHACTHLFTFIYSVRQNGRHFHGVSGKGERRGGLESLFFFILEGS